MSQGSVSAKLLREAVLEGAEDPVFWLRFFLPEWFPTPLPPVHIGLAAIVTRKVSFLEKYPEAHEFLFEHFRYSADPQDDQASMLPIFQRDNEGRIVMVAGANSAFIMPRGFSKTTLLNGLNLEEAVTDPSTFCIYTSESGGHAETQLANIRTALETNELLRAAYGDLVPTRADSQKWTSTQLHMLNGAVLVAKGRGAQIRGTNIQARRPNRILLDDVEDEESVSTVDQRKKTMDWFYRSVMPAGREMSGANGHGDGLQITLLGTLLGSETLLTEVSRDPTFNTVRFGATLTDDLENLTDAQMLWPYKMNTQDYLRKRRQYSEVGKLSAFCLEFDSTVRNTEDAPFQRSMFYYEPLRASQVAQLAIAMDPAISDTPGRDHTAIVVSARRRDGVLWVLDVWGGLGIKPREKIDKFFELWEQWSKWAGMAARAGIEAQAYQRALIHLLQEEMAKRQHFFHVEAIIQGTDHTKMISKDQRILGILAPRYYSGYVKHFRRFGQLETQLLDFPNGKKDYADAEAMSFKLLGETQMLAAPADSIVTRDQYEALDPALPPLLQDGPFIFDGDGRFAGGRYG